MDPNTIIAVAAIATGLGTISLALSSKKQAEASKKQVEALLKQVDASLEQTAAIHKQIDSSSQLARDSMEQIAQNKRDTIRASVLTTASELLGILEEFKTRGTAGAPYFNFGKIMALKTKLRLLLRNDNINELIERMEKTVAGGRGRWVPEYTSLSKDFMREVENSLR